METTQTERLMIAWLLDAVADEARNGDPIAISTPEPSSAPETGQALDVVWSDGTIVRVTAERIVSPV